MSVNNGRSAKRQSSPIDRLFDRLPPHAIEAEMAVLGAMLLDATPGAAVWTDIASRLVPDDFYKPTHAAIYEVMIGIYRSGGRPDLVQLQQSLVNLNALQQVGGLDYLVELASSCSSPASGPHYAEIVRDKSRRRQLIQHAYETLTTCYDDGDTKSVDLLSGLMAKLMPMSVEGERSQLVHIADSIREVREEMEREFLDGVSPAIPTGLKNLDAMLKRGGFRGGQLIVPLARPSIGKSAFAMQIAVNQAKAGHGVAFFTMEMDDKEEAERVIAAEARLSGSQLAGAIDHQYFDRVSDLEKQAAGWPLRLCYCPGITAERLSAMIRMAVARHKIKVAYIDYLHLIKRPGKENQAVELAEICGDIKSLAGELDIPIVLLSQVNRESVAGGGVPDPPSFSSARGSGGIEEHASIGIALHREDYYRVKEDGYTPNHRMQCIIEKQRGGKTGLIDLHFDGLRTRVTDWTERDDSMGGHRY